MTQVRRRYTTVAGGTDYLVTTRYDESKFESAHWFEAKVDAVNEATGEPVKFPKELATYRVGEVEHTFRQYVDLDFAGDYEAAVRHILDTLYRRVYSFIERGH
jgi:hypothetical protein